MAEGSEERGYWAHGYLSALQDVVVLFSRESPTEQEDEHGQSSSRYAA